MDGQSPQLDYAPPPPLRQRRWVRWTIVALLILAASPFAIRWSLTAYELFRVYRLYRAAATYTAPATSVAYDSFADTTATNTTQPILLRTHPEWIELNQANGRSLRSEATLFVHELTSPSGKRRLVGVDLILYPVINSAAFHTSTRVFSAASPLRRPREVTTNSGADDFNVGNRIPTCIFAGQTDPTNPSHFTIAYTANHEPYIVDGWLKDDDTVLLEPRVAPIASPTTAPATAP